MKRFPLCAFSLLLAATPAVADAAAPMPGVAAQLDFDATCTRAMINGRDQSDSCLGFRRSMLANGMVMFMMRIDGHTVAFVGKADPAATPTLQKLSLDDVYLDEAPLLAAGSCTLSGDIQGRAMLDCDVSAVAQGSDFTFKVAFLSKGLLPLKPSKS